MVLGINAMKPLRITVTLLLSMFAVVFTTPVEAKPLKVFILCGQSIMEGACTDQDLPRDCQGP